MLLHPKLSWVNNCVFICWQTSNGKVNWILYLANKNSFQMVEKSVVKCEFPGGRFYTSRSILNFNLVFPGRTAMWRIHRESWKHCEDVFLQAVLKVLSVLPLTAFTCYINWIAHWKIKNLLGANEFISHPHTHSSKRPSLNYFIAWNCFQRLITCGFKFNLKCSYF